MQLPWKRDDADDMSTFVIKQNEFPLCDKKEYNNYYSLTNTFLGIGIVFELILVFLINLFASLQENWIRRRPTTHQL